MIARRLLVKELERDDLPSEERVEIEQMLAGLTRVITIRKRDMPAIYDLPPCENCGRTNTERENRGGRTLCRSERGCVETRKRREL